MERLLNRGNGTLVIAWVLVVIGLSAGPAAAAWDTSDIDGFVDTESLVALADEYPEMTIVEVTIPGSLLRAVGLGVKQNPDLQELIIGLKWVGAVIIETEDPVVQQEARSYFTATERKLTKGGWERLARIRDSGTNVNVLILNGSETVRGLVVMVAEDGEFVFTNLAGIINLELLGELAEEMDIPGLDQIPEEN